MKINIKISGMHCQSCVNIITKALNQEKGVLSANVNFSTEKAAIEYDPKLTNEKTLLKAIKDKGYEPQLIKENSQIDNKKELTTLKRKVIISAALAIPVFILGMFFMTGYLLCLVREKALVQ